MTTPARPWKWQDASAVVCAIRKERYIFLYTDDNAAAAIDRIYAAARNPELSLGIEEARRLAEQVLKNQEPPPK